MARRTPPPPPSSRKRRPPPPPSQRQPNWDWDPTVYEPIVKLEKTPRGCALALVASLQEVLSGRPRRLFWCLDLHRDMGVPKDHPVGSPQYENFMVMMKRFRATVDDQVAHGYPEAGEVGFILRHTITTQTQDKREVVSLFKVPWGKFDYTRVGGDLAVGVWRLWPAEPMKYDSDDILGLPETFWVDGIPF